MVSLDARLRIKPLHIAGRPHTGEFPAAEESPMAKYEKSERAEKAEKAEKAAIAAKLHPTPQAHVVHDAARDSALSRAVQQIAKQFGKGAVMKLDGNARSPIDGIPTGSLSLDIALGGFGVPRGRVVEIISPAPSGKAALTLHIIASTQKLGGVAAFIDADEAFDPSSATRLGGRLHELLVR